MNVTSDSRTREDIRSAKEASTEDKRNLQALKEVIGNANRPTGTYYAAQRYSNAPQDDTVEPTEHISYNFQEAYRRNIQNGKQRPNSTRRRGITKGKRAASKRNAKTAIPKKLYNRIVLSFAPAKSPVELISVKTAHGFKAKHGSNHFQIVKVQQRHPRQQFIYSRPTWRDWYHHKYQSPSSIARTDQI